MSILPKGETGIINLGNTCFMNSALQCLSHTIPLTAFFHSSFHDQINRNNPLSLNGKLATSYAILIRHLYSSKTPFCPSTFKSLIGSFNSLFSSYSQQDSQELLQSLLDGLHEDLNRILSKPILSIPDMDHLSPHEISAKSWEFYKLRNDSIIVDLFQGQYKSSVQCLSCSHFSIKFDPYMFLSVPVPTLEKHILINVFCIPKSQHQHSNDFSSLLYPLKITISLKNSLLFKDLAHVCATKMGWPPTDLLCCQYYQSKVLKIFNNDDPISNISPDDFICILQEDYAESQLQNLKWKIPKESLEIFMSNSKSESESELESPNTIDCVRIPFYFTTENGALFGFPLVLCLPATINISIPKSVAKQLTMQQRDSEINRILGIHLYKHILYNIAKFYSLYDKHTPLDIFMKTMQSKNIQLLNLFKIIKIDSVHSRDANTFYSRGYANTYITTKTIIYPLDCEFQETFQESQSTNDEPDFTVPFDMSGLKLFLMEWNLESAQSAFGAESICIQQDVFSAGTFMYNEHSDNKIVEQEFSNLKTESKNVTLDSCIQEFSKEETLSEEDTWYCPKCKKHQRIKKKLDIWTIPDILVFHLKRFSNNGGRSYLNLADKIDTFVDAPLTDLDLSKYLMENYSNNLQHIEKDDFIYDLYAISNHYGGLGGGHYTAFGKNAFDGNWYNLDDSRVNQTSKDSVMTKAAYLLFYQRKSSQKSIEQMKDQICNFIPLAEPILDLEPQISDRYSSNSLRPQTYEASKSQEINMSDNEDEAQGSDTKSLNNYKNLNECDSPDEDEQSFPDESGTNMMSRARENEEKNIEPLWYHKK